jgi:hypothetical protein
MKQDQDEIIRAGASHGHGVRICIAGQVGDDREDQDDHCQPVVYSQGLGGYSVDQGQDGDAECGEDDRKRGMAP